MREPSVLVQVPASTAYVRLARLNAAGLAADLSFSVEEIEDLRVAVDELFFLLVDGADDGVVELEYRAVDDGLVVSGRKAHVGLRTVSPDDLVREILNVTTDEWDVSNGEDHCGFRLLKRRRPS